MNKPRIYLMSFASVYPFYIEKVEKKEKTNEERFRRLQEDILKGKKTPCCRPGCPHRRERAKKWLK